MWLTVEDVLSIDVMRGADVIAGHDGLGRNIKSVTVLDAPDASLWLQGHELALTSTFPLLKRRNGLNMLVEELVARNVAGLGLKLHRYMTTLPDAMIARANELAFPIFRVPDHIAWIEIISPIFARVLDTDAQHLIRSEEIRSQFTKQLFSGAGLESLMALLYSMLGRPVLLTSPADAHTVWLPEVAAKVDDVMQILRCPDTAAEHVASCPGVMRKRSADFNVVYIRLDQGADPHAYIAALETGEPIDPPLLHCLVHAREAISMSLLQRRANISITREKHNEFVHTLVDPQLSEGARQAHIARGKEKGIPLHDRYFAAVIKFHNLDEHVFRAVASLFHAKMDDDHLLVSSLDSTRFLLLVPETEQSDLHLDGGAGCIERYISEVAKFQAAPDWNAGISQATGVIHLDRAYEQAEYALGHSLKSGEKCRVKLHDETGLYRLLSHPAMQNDIRRFIDEWLQPLLQYDRKRRSRLVATLRVFLDNNGNYRETARLMHVHHNTVRYRISQIYTLTRRDILNPRLRLQYQLALVLHDMNRERAPERE
ncbi:MAG: PucR family transcriptional regulator ligand-binding domain-containing protein [Candidimonas sp.]|nr:PucR family transcriptional regulator ligand-binding domain-containing protein [Candidimonas sp.]